MLALTLTSLLMPGLAKDLVPGLSGEIAEAAACENTEARHVPVTSVPSETCEDECARLENAHPEDPAWRYRGRYRRARQTAEARCGPCGYISIWLEHLHNAFDASPMSRNITLVRRELDCAPHFPRFDDFNGNMRRGSRRRCQKAGVKCPTTEQTASSLWINTESIFRGERLRWSSCDRPANRFYAAAAFGQNREKWRDIPIPTHTYPHPGYPTSAAENEARCARARYDATFKGYVYRRNPEWGGEREALHALAAVPGLLIEFNQKIGEQSERMAQLLHDSRFGFAPAGDGWHSFRLMEIMAMGVVPIIL